MSLTKKEIEFRVRQTEALAELKNLFSQCLAEYNNAIAMIANEILRFEEEYQESLQSDTALNRAKTIRDHIERCKTIVKQLSGEN